MLNMTMGGTETPSLNHPALTRAAFLCQRNVRAKKRAWLGREGLTLTNSEKKIRRPQLRWWTELLPLCIHCSLRMIAYGISQARTRRSVCGKENPAIVNSTPHDRFSVTPEVLEGWGVLGYLLHSAGFPHSVC